MKKRAYFIFLFFFVVFSFLLVNPVYSCSCITADDAITEMKAVDMVFIGKVIKIDELPSYKYKTKFQVIKSYKGTMEDTVEIVHFWPGPSCGISFENDTEYLVYASFWEGELSTNKCRRTRLLSEAKEDLGLLDEFVTSEVADWRQDGGVCRVHTIIMKTKIVNGLAAGAFVDFPPGYYEAKEKLFPNPGIEYPSQLYSDEKGMIYVCPKCEQAKADWEKNK